MSECGEREHNGFGRGIPREQLDTLCVPLLQQGVPVLLLLEVELSLVGMYKGKCLQTEFVTMASKKVAAGSSWEVCKQMGRQRCGAERGLCSSGARCGQTPALISQTRQIKRNLEIEMRSEEDSFVKCQ